MTIDEVIKRLEELKVDLSGDTAFQVYDENAGEVYDVTTLVYDPDEDPNEGVVAFFVS